MNPKELQILGSTQVPEVYNNFIIPIHGIFHHFLIIFSMKVGLPCT